MHIPVMLNEVLKGLDLVPNGVYFDCTFGTGGHSFVISKFLNKHSFLNILDKDLSSFNNFSKKFFFFKKKILFYKCSFNNIDKIIYDNNLFGKINGILVDFGISNYQLCDFDRGFGFKTNGFLDMRLDLYQDVRAVDWFNFASLDELFIVFSFIDNLKFVTCIVNEISFFRKKNKIRTSKDFYDILLKVCKLNKSYMNHFNKVYQSVRTFINNDMFILFSFLKNAFNALNSSGILLFISFNSLEDKIVKNFFKDNSFVSKSFVSFLKPSIEELDSNYSARSAIMRFFVKK